MKINYKRLIIYLALPQLAVMVGSIFTISAIPTWYATLQRPSFSPPNWLFGSAFHFSIIAVFVKMFQEKQADKRFKSDGWLAEIDIYLFFFSVLEIMIYERLNNIRGFFQD